MTRIIHLIKILSLGLVVLLGSITIFTPIPLQAAASGSVTGSFTIARISPQIIDCQILNDSETSIDGVSVSHGCWLYLDLKAGCLNDIQTINVILNNNGDEYPDATIAWSKGDDWGNFPTIVTVADRGWSINSYQVPLMDRAEGIWKLHFNAGTPLTNYGHSWNTDNLKVRVRIEDSYQQVADWSS